MYHTFLIEPLLVRHKRLTQQVAEVRQNIKVTDNLIKGQEQVADPDAVKRAHAEALRRQLAEIDQNMQSLQRGLVQPERMAKLLEEMLARGRGLQLVSLRTLPVQRFETPGAGPAAKPGEQGPKPGPKEPERSIYQHSFEISVQGSYADLHDYLARLERLPWQMFWDACVSTRKIIRSSRRRDRSHAAAEQGGLIVRTVPSSGSGFGLFVNCEHDLT